MTHHNDTLKMFDEEFPIWWGAHGGLLSPKEVKSFLTSRHLAYQNLLVERGEGMKKEIIVSEKLGDWMLTQEYNQALTDIIALIKTL